jgi:hypothetical protein
LVVGVETLLGYLTVSEWDGMHLSIASVRTNIVTPLLACTLASRTIRIPTTLLCEIHAVGKLVAGRFCLRVPVNVLLGGTWGVCGWNM